MSTSLDLVKQTFSLKNLDLTKKCPAVIIAPTGTKVSAYPFPKIKFSTDRKSRISILSDDVCIVKLHYDEDLKYVLCTEGACCDLLNEPSVRYLYPCVRYSDVTDSGKPLTNQVEVFLLQLSKSAYDVVSTVYDVKESLIGLDFVVACEDATYQKISLTEAGPSKWIEEEGNVEMVKEYLSKNSDRFLSAVGKVYTDAKLRELKGDLNANPMLPAESIEDVFKI